MGFDKFSNLHRKVAFPLALFMSVLVVIYSLFGSSFKIGQHTDSCVNFSNHGRQFVLQKSNEHLNLVENGKILTSFNNKEFYGSKTKYNCALAAVIATGATLPILIAKFGEGFLGGMGLAYGELDALFAMAAEGATVAEIIGAIKGMLGFWGLVGVGLGGIA